MKRVFPLLVLFTFLLQPLLKAQDEDPSRLNLDRLFDSDEFDSKGFGPARWIDEGAGYTTLERSDSDKAGGGRDIVCYDTETGKRSTIVPCAWLIPKGEKSPLHIADYDWSTDKKRLLVFTNTKRVWRHNTRGDYWVLDLGTKKLCKLGGDAKPSTLKFAGFSPDGTRVAYVREKNIYVEDLMSGRITALTTDGGGHLINGTFDWVYEEEFGLRNGFRWSPDGRWIAYWQIDTAGVREFCLINNTDELYPRLTHIQYPKAGTTNPACRVGVVCADGGDTVWMNLPGDNRDNYIARMDWAASPDEIVLQRLNRLQNTDGVTLCGRETGDARTVLTETDEAWLDVVDDLMWLDNGKRFTWVSERDGWRRVYVVARTGEEMKPVTPAGFDAISVAHVDEKDGMLYYIASPDDPSRRFLYCSPMDGSCGAWRLTPPQAVGSHSYDISPDSRYAFHTFSSFGVPPVIELVRLPSHETVRTLQDNAALKEKLGAVERGEEGFFRVEIGDGNVELDAWCIKPPGFDPEKQYPLFFYVYGEPAGQTVLDRWGGRYYLWHLMLAQQGYVVMSVDNRGTPAPRGREWRKCVYRKVGLLPSQDQAAAARAIIESRPWIDKERIGIWGWSGGGSMSLNMIFRYPKLYRTAMAVATVSDQRLYDTIYMERYMGLPIDNPDDYKNGSPVTFANRLEGNLLIVHGTGDDNCHYQGMELLINELVAHNKQFTMMAYPNRSHGIHEGKNTRRHLYTLLTRCLNENLCPGPR